MAVERVHLSVSDARELAEGALTGIGYDDEAARIIADHVVDAALCGYEYSGLPKILNLPESASFKLPRRPMKLLRETEVSAAFDGGNNVGMLTLFQAAEATIRKAQAHGMALVSVNDAWMSGRSAYYVEMIANAGLVAIHTPADAQQKKTIAVAVKLAGDPWWNRMEEGLKEYDKESSAVHVFMQGPSQADAALQAQLIEDLIAQKVNAIGIIPLSPQTLEPVVVRTTRLGSDQL